jgi:hypothetical protein
MDAQPAGPAPTGADEARHRELAQKLAARRSIEHLRRGLLAGFISLLTVAGAGRLLWVQSRPGAPPSEWGPWLVALAALAGAGLVMALVSLLLARRAMREEDGDFRQMLELRARLGLDP